MNHKILIADDDTTMFRFLNDYLVERSFEVIWATDGVEALKRAYHEHPDLVLVDIMMPQMDGWELIARLRELTDIPIIILTVRDDEADILRGFKLGVDDYITKPFSFAQLTARIQAVLNRTQQANSDEPNLLPFGDMMLDLNKRVARRSNQVIPLTPTEFRLLEALARHQGSTVAEEVLIEEVWGPHHINDTAAVRRYIWLLRQKVEKDPSNPELILTVRGFGYRVGTARLHDPSEREQHSTS